MKKVRVLLLAVLAMAATTTFAQSGKIWFDGNLGFNTKTTKDANDNKLGSMTFDLGLSGNYMLTDNISLGLVLGYGMSSTDYMVDYANKQNTFTVGVQAYYFQPICKSLLWTPRAYFGYRSITGLTEVPVVGDVDDPSVTGLTFMVEPLAFRMNLNDHLAFTTALQLGRIYFQTTSVENAGSSSEFNFDLGNISGLVSGNIGFRLGFAYTL